MSDMNEKIEDLKKSIETFGSLANFVELKGETDDAINYYNLALKAATDLYDLTKDERDLRIKNHYSNKVSQLERGKALEEEELRNSEIDEEDLKTYKEMLDGAHTFLKDAEFEYMYENYEDSLMLFEMVMQFAYTAFKINPTTKALELFWYAAYKANSICLSLENASDTVKYGKLALSIAEDLYEKNPNDDTARKISTSLNSLALSLLIDDKEEEAIKLYKRALEIEKDLLKRNENYNAYKQIAMTLLQIAHYYEFLGKDKETLQYYKQLEETLSTIFLKFEDEAQEEDKDLLDFIRQKKLQ